jgi:hypothetical protein
LASAIARVLSPLVSAAGSAGLAAALLVTELNALLGRTADSAAADNFDREKRNSSDKFNAASFRANTGYTFPFAQRGSKWALKLALYRDCHDLLEAAKVAGNTMK